jgi:hypothetical protein
LGPIAVPNRNAQSTPREMVPERPHLASPHASTKLGLD